LIYREANLKIVGRPIYIKREDTKYVPYEHESLKMEAKKPYLDHKLQLSCYMMLIEEFFGQKANCGMITYANNKTFKVDNTLALRHKLDKRIRRLKDLKMGKVSPVRNHHIFEKCFACKYYSNCKDRLGKR